MKKHFFEALTALVLALLIAFGAVGSLADVYFLQGNWVLPLTVGLLTSLVCAIFLPRRHGPELVLCLAALSLGFGCTLPETLAQTKGLLTQVTQLLDGIYHLGYLNLPGPISGNTEIPLAIYGGLLVWSVCLCLLRRKSCALPLLLSLPSLVLCGMMTALAPKPYLLLCWLAGSMLLLLTAGSWKNAAAQGLALTQAAILPVVLLCGLVFWLNPQSGYQDHAQGLRNRLLTFLEERQGPGFATPAPLPPLSRTADLAALTTGEQPMLPILVVTSPVSGDLYLRGQDFDRYTGTGWVSDAQRTESFSGWGDSAGELQIRTFALQNVLYLPYFPGSGTVLTGGVLENTAGLLSYSFPQYARGSAAGADTLRACLQLTEEADFWGKAWALEGSAAEKAAQIGEMVRSSARYDKATGQMPPEETDFARWFFEGSDTGYCVHFATAAVVLLRAQGVPARYVTGFRCQVQAGQPQVVTTQEAHAWAEYYDDALGSWEILEATAQADTPRPTPVPTEVPEPTAASTVQPTTASEPSPAATPETPSSPPSVTIVMLLALPLLALLLILRRQVCLRLRRHRREQASVNRRCILWWAEAERLSKALGKAPPEDLLALAERARYSHHRLTPMDLTPLTDYCVQCREALDARPLWRRLLDKYIFLRY